MSYATLLTRALVGLALSSVGCSTRAMVESRIVAAGSVVKEYEKDGYKYFVVKAGHRYVKYAYALDDPTIVGYLYEVDTLIQACMWQAVQVECAHLARDPDLAPFITWTASLPAPTPAREPAPATPKPAAPEAETPAPAP